MSHHIHFADISTKVCSLCQSAHTILLKLNPELYLLQPEQTLHYRCARGYFIAVSLNMSPAECIVMFVQDEYLNLRKGIRWLSTVWLGTRKETHCWLTLRLWYIKNQVELTTNFSYVVHNSDNKLNCNKSNNIYKNGRNLFSIQC
jgi:hypothetical protein